MNDFLLLPDLLDSRVGGEVLSANDEFFAPKENLIKPGDAVWLADEYTDRGKWMDGWETRRRREPGYDWVILRLGLPGEIHGVVVDTSHFRGNYPESCSIEACAVPEGTPLDELLAPAGESGVVWRELLGLSMLEGNSKNQFAIADRERATHLRLNIHPDGGVARLRAHGRVLPDWSKLDAAGEPVDLVAISSGGRALACSDECFGPAANLLMPGTARNIGDGWETRRRRGEGYDWAILQLGTPGVIERVVVDTSHFIGNAPGSCSLEWCHAPADADPMVLNQAGADTWHTLLARTPLQPNREHTFGARAGAGAGAGAEAEAALEAMEPATHVRFCIHPDGGVARLRLYGQSVRSRQLARGLARLQELDDDRVRSLLSDCCASKAWLDGMLESRPLADLAQLWRRATEVWTNLGEDDWREAFAAHPRIGGTRPDDADQGHDPDRFARWSAAEQAGVTTTPADTLESLARANDEYHERFGHIFIVFASGKSAEQMLALLRRRLDNPAAAELRVAAAEQDKITQVRLQKLLLELAGESENRDHQA